MRARGLHHVAMAVSDLDEAIALYEGLFGATVELRERVAGDGVEAAYLRVGEGRIELLEALDADTPVGRFVARRGPGLHHIALQVDDVTRALGELAARGVTVVDEEPREGLGGRRVGFVHPESVDGVLVEVLEDG